MTKTNLLIATALSTAMVLVPSVTANDEGENTTIEIKREAALYSKEKHALFGTLFQAHMSLELEAKEQAEQHLNKAFKQLEEAIEVGAEAEILPETQISKVVKLTYGNPLLPTTVYAPVDDGLLSVDDFSDVLQLKSIERGDIEDAEVKYVRLHINSSKLLHELNEARNELTAGDFDSARDQVLDAQTAMFFEFDAARVPEIVAKDHVSLARFMVKAAEYEGAKEALQSAEKAMISLKLDVDGAGRTAPDVASIREEMKEVEQLLEKRDPSLAQQIDARLEAWWSELS